MYTMVLLAALIGGENAADFGHHKGCYGGAHSCYGGCYGSCYGYGYCHGGCYGGCCGGWSNGCGGCYGTYGCCGGCCGGSYGSAYYGGCYGGSCYGGCWGAPYSGYGAGCVGGCGGYLSPAYGVPGPSIGVPAGAGGMVIGDASPAPDAKKADKKDDKETDGRAVIVFKLPEGAKLFVEGQQIEITGDNRTFRSPALEADKLYVYAMRVEVMQKDEKMVGEKTVTVKAGRTEEVDFTTVELKKDSKVASR